MQILFRAVFGLFALATGGDVLQPKPDAPIRIDIQFVCVRGSSLQTYGYPTDSSAWHLISSNDGVLLRKIRFQGDDFKDFYLGYDLSGKEQQLRLFEAPCLGAYWRIEEREPVRGQLGDFEVYAKLVPRNRNREGERTGVSW